MMTDEHEAHLKSLLAEARQIIEQKYRRGNARFDEKLWEFTPLRLCEEALMEATDQMTYLIELHRQLLESPTS